jgi:myo-inositol 2-dehydrogenase/D-chiro-inositol 1-dehydrogenase
VDAVCICSASNQHTKQIMEAARAGKHIFCEKPIDTDLKKIDEALKVVEECGVKFQVGFNRRFDQNYSRVRQAIVRGEVSCCILVSKYCIPHDN